MKKKKNKLQNPQPFSNTEMSSCELQSFLYVKIDSLGKPNKTK